MKIFLMLILFVLLAHQTNARDSIFTQVHGIKLKLLIESFREVMKNGNEAMNVSAIDPLRLDAQSRNITLSMFDGKLDAESVHISGISNYIVKEAKFKVVGLVMTINLHWPMIKVNLNSYTLTGQLHKLIKINGRGNAELNFRDCKFSSEFLLHFNFMQQALSVTQAKSNISLENLEIISLGDLNNEAFSKMVNYTLTNETPKLIETYQEPLVNFINTYLMKEVNDHLKTIKFQNVMSTYLKLLPNLVRNKN